MISLALYLVLVMMECIALNQQNVSDSSSYDERNAIYLSGEEIGMTNVRFESIDEYRDIETLNMYKEKVIDHGEDIEK